jgi:LysR family transcriptional regulator, hca operon transcriptional activator
VHERRGLLSRGARGVELTAAGRAFLDHARLALAQVDAAAEAARRASTWRFSVQNQTWLI